MPTVTDTKITAFAHCARARCPGNQQEEVEAIQRETARTYREHGGTSPGVESSFVSYVFADEDQMACRHCGKSREISTQARRMYDPLTGTDPFGLLNVPSYNPAKQAEVTSKPLADPEREAMVAQMEELKGQVLALQAAQEPKAA